MARKKAKQTAIPLRKSASVREAVSHFAHLTRQFVLESGLADLEQDREALETFLQASVRPANGLSFYELNNVNEALSRPSPDGRDNTTLTPVATRNEIIFAELRGVLQN
ncbi:MAG: hypothetical protein FWC13_13585 [Oscillospiraceae bacterium]|nr:hypothetical protein [Oscillospiraceae bacterium]